MYTDTQNQRGSATIWSIICLGIALVVIQQVYSRIQGKRSSEELDARKAKLNFVADYFRLQMNRPEAALNTRKANIIFDKQASLLPSESNFDFDRHPLEVRDAKDAILVPISGAYMDNRMDIVSSSDPKRFYYIQAFWQRVGPVATDVEDQYPKAKMPEELESEIRVRKIIRVSLAEKNGKSSPAIENSMGADLCVVARGTMKLGILDYRGVNVETLRGVVTCPKGYFLLSSYMVNSAATEDSYRVKWINPDIENSMMCTVWIDAAGSNGYASRYASGMVFNTVNGGVDASRSVLPQNWLGKVPYPNQPLNKCYALCCDKTLGK